MWIVAYNSPAHADSVNASSLTGRAAEPGPTTSNAAPSSQPKVTASLTDEKGKAELIRICTSCHGTDTFSHSRMSREEWQGEVNNMVARGAKGTDAEIQLVVEYLARNLGSSPKPPAR